MKIIRMCVLPLPCVALLGNHIKGGWKEDWGLIPAGCYQTAAFDCQHLGLSKLQDKSPSGCLVCSFCISNLPNLEQP